MVMRVMALPATDADAADMMVVALLRRPKIMLVADDLGAVFAELAVHRRLAGIEFFDAFADRIEARLEGLAPGFRVRVQGRAVHTPEDLEAMDENLVGGDLGGGSARFSQQLFFRPVFPYFRYRTPVRGLYLASASAHPGAGVHGACGFNAARMAQADNGERLVP